MNKQKQKTVKFPSNKRQIKDFYRLTVSALFKYDRETHKNNQQMKEDMTKCVPFHCSARSRHLAYKTEQKKARGQEEREEKQI